MLLESLVVPAQPRETGISRNCIKLILKSVQKRHKECNLATQQSRTKLPPTIRKPPCLRLPPLMQKALSFIPYYARSLRPLSLLSIIETPATQSNRWKSEQTNKHKTRRGITYLHCVCARGTQPTIQAFFPSSFSPPPTLFVKAHKHGKTR